MDVTLKNGKQFIITLRAWDGANWMPDCAGDVLATWQPEISYIIYYDGRQTTGALRITQAHAANKLGLTVPELLEKFKLD